MTAYTKLEKLVHQHPEWKKLRKNASKKNKQAVLDKICEEIVSQLTNKELMQSVIEVYSQTVEEYTENPHTQDITDDLIKFMLSDKLHNNARILDIGCGPGRDTFFMFYNHLRFREVFMNRKDKEDKTTLEKFGVPHKKFKTIGVDGSSEMINLANKKATLLRRRFSSTSQPFFICKDIHNITFDHPVEFDGIWSCASLFTHTPHDLIEPAIESIVNLMKPEGVFFISYTNGLVSGKYNKLILSSTGRIKWFSQPDPNEIIAIAQKYGLKQIENSVFDDYRKGKDFEKNLFVSHFFQKAS